MTVKEALLMDRYTEKEAETQIKHGAWLLSVNDYVDNLRGTGSDEEEIKYFLENVEMTKNIAKVNGSYFFADGISLIIDGEDVYILEKCL